MRILWPLLLLGVCWCCVRSQPSFPMYIGILYFNTPANSLVSCQSKWRRRSSVFKTGTAVPIAYTRPMPVPCCVLRPSLWKQLAAKAVWNVQVTTACVWMKATGWKKLNPVADAATFGDLKPLHEDFPLWKSKQMNHESLLMHISTSTKGGMYTVCLYCI